MNINHFKQRMTQAAQWMASVAGARAAMILQLLLMTSASAWAQNEPTARLEVVDGMHGSIYVRAWCEDPDALSTPLYVNVYVKDSNNQPVNGLHPITLTANQKRFGEDNQWHYNGLDQYLPITTAGTYKVDVWFIDATGDAGPIYSRSGIEVAAPYTVTYNTNGGSGVPSQLKHENVPLTLSSTVPTRDGHNFLHWSTAPGGGGTSYSPGATYTANADVTLYAQWIASDFPGSGTATDPYVISTTAQWNLFANNVNNGNTYSGKYFAMGADITVSTMAGTNDYPFSGTFIGNGHTMNLAINGTGTGGGHPNIAVAPFRYVSGATFKNINITGTVSRYDYPGDANVSLSGLVGAMTNYRSVTITGCHSSVTANYKFTWDTEDFRSGHIGGFIGWCEAGNITITDCLFDGAIHGRPNYQGGFIGRLLWGKATFNNCLMNGTSDANPTYKGAFFGRDVNGGDGPLNNCYFKTVVGQSQGTLTSATGETLRALLGDSWIMRGNAVVPGKVQTLSTTANNSAAIATAAGARTTYDRVTLNDYTLYTDGTWNTIVLPFNLATLTGTPLAGATVKTLATSNYTTQDDGTLTMTFADATSIEAGKPYIVNWTPDFVIRSEEDWNSFASKVNNGTESYAGKMVMLAADITVSTMAGDGNSFKGTFDGCGHTLTFNKAASVANIAPFRNAENATFRNLRTAGTINTNGKFAAGLVAISSGACTIENCRNSIVINSTVSGDGTHGGFIACCNSGGTVSFSNCLFDGTISGSNTTKCGGYVGWRNAPVTFTNCLMAGTMALNDNNSSCAIFNRNNASSTTLTNCYYKGSFGSAAKQGTSTSATGSALQALLGSGWEVSGNNVVPKMSVIENPVFTGVTISNATANVSTTYASFNGSYTPFASGPLFDAHNTSHHAMHAAISLATVEKTGYTFAGWYTDAARQTTVTTIPFAADGSVTLYAKWTLNTYTITYNLAGGSVATDNPATYTVESDAITLVNPTREGYEFAGWTGNDLTEPTMTVTIPTGSTGNRTYTATWQANEIALENNSDNSDLIAAAAASGKTFETMTLNDRTIFTDGDWNTLCLPFALASLTGTPLEGATVKTLTSSDFEDGTLTMTFSDNLTAIEAGKPYIVKWKRVDLSTLTANYTAQDNEMLTGTLSGNYKISIADGATVTLNGVTINGTNKNSYKWAGINCIGNATIILKGTNTVKGFYYDYPGIHVPSGKTLTIKGNGSLTVSSNGHGAGIGGGYNIACGNIRIEGGTITATGGSGSAGIGSGAGEKNTCGNITIAGGTINTTGGSGSAGIGSGIYVKCGNITITNTVTSVTATKGSNATNSIGKGYGKSSSCGTVTIGGVVGAISTSPYTYTGNGTDSGSASESTDIVNPVFTNVTISSTPAATETAGSEWVDFVGTYSPVGIYESGDEKHNLYLGSGNNIYYPSNEGYKVKSCRAYFVLKNGLTAGEPTSPSANVRAFVLNFDEGEETGIKSIDDLTIYNLRFDAEAWYTLDGRKLDGKPTMRGIYIKNGKKVVIK